MAADDEARAWIATHKDQTTSGCIEVSSHRMDPVDRVKL